MGMLTIEGPEQYTAEICELYLLCKKEMLPSNARAPTVNLRITDDFQQDCYRLSYQKDRDYFDVHGVPDLNGRVILPFDESLTFTVLIASRQFQDDQYQHTTVHEFTHVFDYHRLFLYHGNLYIASEEIRQENYFTEFYYWSEYHAKRFGMEYYAIRKWLEVNQDLPEDGQPGFASVDFQTQYLVNQLKQLDPNLCSVQDVNLVFWSVLEDLVQYYGRQAAFQKPHLDELPDNRIPRDLLEATLGPDSLRLYWTLLPCRTYEECGSHLGSIRTDMRAITKHVNQRWAVSLVDGWHFV